MVAQYTHSERAFDGDSRSEERQMTTQLIAFALFAVLTLVFAAVLLWRLIPRSIPPQPNLAAQSQAVRNAVAAGAESDEIKAIADAISTILKSLGDFGAKLDTFGPIAVLGIFTVIFALLTFASAWLIRST
jgi:hypothetical protein